MQYLVLRIKKYYGINHQTFTYKEVFEYMKNDTKLNLYLIEKVINVYNNIKEAERDFLKEYQNIRTKRFKNLIDEMLYRVIILHDYKFLFKKRN